MIRRVFTGPAAITAAMVVLAACLQIGLGALFPAHGQTAPAASGAPLPFWTERPCPLEDSVNCAWDAGTMGDGNGHSFTVRKVPHSRGLVCIFYAERDYARTHDKCERQR